MVTYPNSFELILGTKKDPVFGSVIMVGMGGVAAEVFQDRALGLPPLNDVLARRMLESLKSWPLLARLSRQAGGEHRPADRDHHAILLPRGRLPRDQGIGYQSAVGYARGRRSPWTPAWSIDRQPLATGGRPYAHLAIRPYPEEYVTERKLKDGTRGRCCGRSSPRTSRCGTICWQLLDAVAVVPLQLPVQADDARDGHAVLLHRLRSRIGASWPRSRKKASGS